MEMGRAVTRTRTARMTTKGNRFALFVATVGVAAIAAFQLDQGKVARIDFDAAQLDRFRFISRWRRPGKPGRWRDNQANFPQPVDSVLKIGSPPPPIGSSEPEPPGTPDHGVTRISRVESLVDNRR